MCYKAVASQLLGQIASWSTANNDEVILVSFLFVYF